MVMVIAIVAILVSMVISIARRIGDQGKERLTKGTIALIGSALEQFRDFGYDYRNNDYAGLTFPIDCNGYYPPILETVLRNALYTSMMPTPDIFSRIIPRPKLFRF